MNDSFLFDHLNYWVFIVVMMLGLWAMISKKNLIKKIMGMGIFQSSIILFYVSIATKDPGASIPIYPHELMHPSQAAHATHETAGATVDSTLHDRHGETAQVEPEAARGAGPGETARAYPDVGAAHSTHHKIAAEVNPGDYDNPLPHVLMLTAIVVGVATLGVALSLVQRLFRLYGSIEEDEILAAIARDASDGLTPDGTDSPEPQKAGSHA